MFVCVVVQEILGLDLLFLHLVISASGLVYLPRCLDLSLVESGAGALYAIFTHDVRCKICMQYEQVKVDKMA